MSANTTTVKVKKTDLSGTSTAYKAVAVVILILLVIFFLFPPVLDCHWFIQGCHRDQFPRTHLVSPEPHCGQLCPPV